MSCTASRNQTIDVVHRYESVQIGKCCLHPLTKWFVVVTCQQWIEPDDFLASSFQVLHLPLEQTHIATVPAVADDDNHRAMGNHARSKVAVESMQRAPDVGSTRPAKNTAGNLFQGIGDVLRTDQMSDAAEGSAKDKSLHAPEFVLQPVHELNQESAVAIHRTAHIAKQHDPGLFDAPFAIDQVDNLATVLHVLAHGPARIHDVALSPELLAPADL